MYHGCFERKKSNTKIARYHQEIVAPTFTKIEKHSNLVSHSRCSFGSILTNYRHVFWNLDVSGLYVSCFKSWLVKS